jgi:hypothetical protein
LRGSLSLTLEAPLGARVERRFSGAKLQRYGDLELHMASHPDRPHPSASKGPYQPILAADQLIRFRHGLNRNTEGPFSPALRKRPEFAHLRDRFQRDSSHGKRLQKCYNGSGDMPFERCMGLVWLCAAASAGCTAVLGLDDLSYDQDPSRNEQLRPVDAVSSDASTSPSGTSSPDGSPSVLPGPSYPALWEDSQLLVFAAGTQRTFSLYDRISGSLETHRPTPPYYEVVQTWHWAPGFSSVLEIPVEPERSKLLGYDASSGMFQYVTVDDRDYLQGDMRAGTAGWTHMLALPLVDVWYLITYNRRNGHYRVGRTDPDPKELPYAGTWQRNLTHLIDYRLESGEAAVLKFDSATGEAEIDQVVGNDATVQLYRGDLGAGWTSLMAIERDYATELLLYDAQTGVVKLGLLELDDSLHFTVTRESLWREAISSMLPIAIDSQPFAVTHSVATGVADALSLDPLFAHEPPVVR